MVYCYVYRGFYLYGPPFTINNNKSLLIFVEILCHFNALINRCYVKLLWLINLYTFGYFL